MPLFSSGLQADLTRIFSNPSSQSLHKDIANAIVKYFGPITPPSTGVYTGSFPFISNISSRPKSGRDVLYSLTDLLPGALLTYSSVIALGMAPAFTGIIPSAPVPNFKLLFDSLTKSQSSAQQCATTIANSIHTWAVTGLAINNTTGITIPWGAPSISTISVNANTIVQVPGEVMDQDTRNSYQREAIQAEAEGNQLQPTDPTGATTAFEYSRKRFSEVSTGTEQSVISNIDIQQTIDNTPTELKSDIGLLIVQTATSDIGILETGTPPGLNYGGFPGGLQLAAPGRIDQMLSSCGLDNQAKVKKDGSGYYWCAAAVMQWYKEAGATTPPSGQASCDVWKNWGQSTGLFRQNPVIGAAVLYGTMADANHIGIVSGISPTGQITTIEGNTSGGGFNRNGVGVFSKVPNTAKIIGYVHPRAIS